MQKKSLASPLRLSEISSNKIKDYIEGFDILDRNNSGKILASDIIKINKIFGIKEEKIKDIIKDIKNSHKEELFFIEFIEYMQEQNKIIKEISKNKIFPKKVLGKKRKREKINFNNDSESKYFEEKKESNIIKDMQ